MGVAILKSTNAVSAGLSVDPFVYVMAIVECYRRQASRRWRRRFAPQAANLGDPARSLKYPEPRIGSVSELCQMAP
jgi:hypothetical protein